MSFADFAGKAVAKTGKFTESMMTGGPIMNKARGAAVSAVKNAMSPSSTSMPTSRPVMPSSRPTMPSSRPTMPTSRPVAMPQPNPIQHNINSRPAGNDFASQMASMGMQPQQSAVPMMTGVPVPMPTSMATQAAMSTHSQQNNSANELILKQYLTNICNLDVEGIPYNKLVDFAADPGGIGRPKANVRDLMSQGYTKEDAVLYIAKQSLGA